MKVWMIRHGESETNQSGSWTGWLDAALTKRGREEAALVGQALSKVSFDKIYTSDLQRARMTAEIAIPGCTYECTPMLREVNVGNIAGKPLGIVADSERAVIAKEGYGMFGGESKEQFKARLEAFMKQLECQSFENVALFSHAGILKGVLNIVLGVEIPRNNLICNNCTVAIFEYDHSTWRLQSWINL